MFCIKKFFMNNNDYNNYLTRKTAELIRENFSEKQITNLLAVKTGKKWRRTLGHIKTLENKEYGSLIEINPLLFDLDVPEFVLDYVIMHELTHYFQGFASNHEKKHKYPHKGRIVEKELERKGWREIQEKSDLWLKKNWTIIITKNGLKPRIKRKPKKFFKRFFG
jgi:predicted SprT family Zn-dependent metalloprotease